MCPNEEVGKDSAPAAAPVPIRTKRLAGKKECGARNLDEFDGNGRENRFPLFDAPEPDRNFSINHGVDEQRAQQGRGEAHRQSCAVAESDLARTPSGRNRIRIASRLMVDKLTTVSKARLGERIGRLDDEDAVRLNRAMVVFLGLA